MYRLSAVTPRHDLGASTVVGVIGAGSWGTALVRNAGSCSVRTQGGEL